MQIFSGSVSTFVKMEAIITLFFIVFFSTFVKCLKQSLAQRKHSINAS